jgi:hypothetical protein
MDKLKDCIAILEKFCQEQIITINGAKSQLTKLNGNYEPSEYLTINNTILQNVQNMKYLEVILNEKLSIEDHIEDRKTKASRSLYFIGQIGIFSEK